MDTGQVISHYEILSLLGGGGMGVVFRARDLKLERSVALKFLPVELSRDEEANARFMQEAKAASALDHPNICTIHEVGEADDGRVFIAMALYEGMTLKKRLAQHGPLDPGEAVDIARQVAHGLAAAHEQGIVHRDVKPANVMITPGGLVKVLDFGLAKLAGGLALTRSGSTLGTSYYMAPEQIRGDEVDARADLWSLGVVLHEMLAGRRPFEGDYEQAVTYAILNETPERQSSGSDDLHGVVAKLLQKDPGHRYRSAQDLITDLNGLPDMRSGVDEKPTRHIASARTALVSGAVLILAGFLWVLLTSILGRDDTQPALDADMIAVMPFFVRGDPELDYLGEGLVDLLSIKLDGAGNLVSVDPNALLGTIVKDNLQILDPDDALKLAGKFGAGRAILGRVTKVGEEIQLSTSVYSKPDVPELEVVSTITGETNIIAGLDDLVLKIARELYDEPPEGILSLGAMTTGSLPALKAYLQGEREVRRVRFREALEHFKTAVREDSTFALAWARVSWCAGWAIDVDLEQEGLRKAMQYRQTLPDHLRQALLVANSAFRAGEPEKAIELARSILVSRPKDLIVLQLLGETLYHYNPYLGHLESESKEYFERALTLAPDHGESIPHLFHIALEDRNFPAADSLSLLHMHASGDRELRDTYTRLYSIAHRTPGDTTWAFLERGDEPPFLEIGRTIRFIANALEDPDAVFRIASSMIRSDKLPEETRLGVLTALSVATATKGQLKVWDKYLDTPDERLHGFRLLLGAGLYSLPVYPVGDDELQALYREIVAWDTLAHPILFLRKKRHVGDYGIVRDFLAGAIAQRMGDQALVDMHLRRLKSKADSSATDDLANSFVRYIEAVRAWHRGELEVAMEAIEDSRLRVLWRSTHESALTEQPLNRFVRAELLKATGHLQKSADAYRSLVTQEYPTGVVLLGPSYLRLAEIYEEMGDNVKAIEYYSRLVRLWKDCDPELIPIRNDAEANRDRLLAETVKEPEP